MDSGGWRGSTIDNIIMKNKQKIICNLFFGEEREGRYKKEMKKRKRKVKNTEKKEN